MMVTGAESNFFEALSTFRDVSRLGATRLGRLFDCSPDTVKSLLTRRRRPGPAILRQIELAMDGVLRQSRFQFTHPDAGALLDAVQALRRERASRVRW